MPDRLYMLLVVIAIALLFGVFWQFNRYFRSLDKVFDEPQPTTQKPITSDYIPPDVRVTGPNIVPSR